MLLTGPTLSLRPPDPDDAEALLALGGDPEVTRWFSWGPYTSIAQPRAYIAEQAGKRERGEQLDLLMVHREAGPVGITGLAEWSPRDRRAIVGTWFAREWWGSGLNEEAKALVAHLGFRFCGLQRIGAYSDVHNARSQRALEKVGYRREGVLRGWHRHGDVQKDVAMYGLLLAEFEASPARALDVALQGAVPAAFALV